MYGRFAEQQKQVAVIKKWRYYQGGRKARFHYSYDHLTRFGFQALAIVPIVCRMFVNMHLV